MPRLFDEPRVLRGQRAQEHARTTVKFKERGEENGVYIR
nr:MAG TPA: hypothetical protein [Caudoviricetes sp.]